jgi:GMP synthase-like glutamine amidotransferase
VLAGRGINLDVVELDAGDALPAWSSAGIVVVMGGPMSVNDESEHSWLSDEKRWISEAVAHRVPFFGVCLGAQLLASSLGAPVRAGERPEVGVLPVELTEKGSADPIFGGLGTDLVALQWHGDTFGLPTGAVHLARSAAYENQAFRVGECAYAMQFHLEVTDSMLEEWARVPAYVDSLARTLGPDGFEILAAQFARHRKVMAAAAASLSDRFLDVALAQDTTVR